MLIEATTTRIDLANGVRTGTMMVLTATTIMHTIETK